MTSHPPEMTGTRTDAIRQLLAERVRDEPEFRRRRTRRRILTWGGIGLVTIGGLSTAGSILFGQAPITDHAIVHCLSSTVPQANGEFPGSAATVAHLGGPGRVDDALELCTEMWRQGVLSGPVDPLRSTYTPQAFIPEMQVCVMRDGTAAVAPSDDPAICQSLGMASAE